MIVQIKNPRSGRYTQIDKAKGRIIGSTAKPKKGVKIVKRKNKKN